MSIPKISLGFPPGPLALEAAELDEELGYHRFWLYDSASIWEDIWITMGLVGDRTSRIGLGAAVLIPSLRHVMTTASAIATIDRLYPGRFVAGFGTGFTGRVVMGQKALTWKYTERYIRQLKELLAGEVVEIDGAPCQMIHHPAMAKARPIDVKMVLSAVGAKGKAIAREIADGVITFIDSDGTWDPFVRMVDGTVLEPGESPHSDRAIDAAGPWWVMAAHGQWQLNGPDGIRDRPGGEAYLARIAEERPEGERHLAVHEGHCTHLTDRDRILIDATDGQPRWHGWVGEGSEIKRRVEAEGAAGVTELIFNVAGEDPLREIRAFADATMGARR